MAPGESMAVASGAAGANCIWQSIPTAARSWRAR
jgi:hypothetical protein